MEMVEITICRETKLMLDSMRTYKSESYDRIIRRIIRKFESRR